MAEAEADNHDYEIKLVIVGDVGVGKSNLLHRYTRKEFNIESIVTIGVAFDTITVEIEDRVIKMQIWDTSGQERFSSIVSSYYRRAVGAVLCYDISKRSSFESLDTWLQEVRSQAEPDAAIVLVGTKSDLVHLRAVSEAEGAEYAKKNGLLFIETSALESQNVEEAFGLVAAEIFKTLKSQPPMEKAIDKRLSLNKDPLAIFCKCL